MIVFFYFWPVDGLFLCRLVRFYSDAVQVVDFYLCHCLFYLVLTFDSFAVITNEAGDGGNSRGDIVWDVVLSQVVFYVLYSQV